MRSLRLRAYGARLLNLAPIIYETLKKLRHKWKRTLQRTLLKLRRDWTFSNGEKRKSLSTCRKRETLKSGTEELNLGSLSTAGSCRESLHLAFPRQLEIRSRAGCP